MHTFAKELLKKILMMRVGETLSQNEIDGIIFELGSELTDGRTLLINADNQHYWIKVSDILLIDKPAKDTFVQTMDGKYKYHDRSIDLLELFEAEERFKYVNKRLLADISKIKKYDSKLGIVYFHESASNQYPFAPVVKSFVDSYLKRKLGSEFDVYEEYDPLQTLIYR